jgi:hypothetical protein
LAANPEITECLVEQCACYDDAECQDGGSCVEVIVELCKKIANKPCYTSCLIKIVRNIFPIPKEYLVLFVIEEMIRIQELEEAPAEDSPQDYDHSSTIFR